MHIVMVQIHVRQVGIAEFIRATEDNARMSIQESGITRFDFLQSTEDATRFVLIEVYKEIVDQAKHRETPHYKRWKETVAPLMAEPRQGLPFINLVPADEKWSK